MLPETMAKLFFKNKDYHVHDIRGSNLLSIPAGTQKYLFNSAKTWNAISSKIDIKSNLVKVKFNLKNTCYTVL